MRRALPALLLLLTTSLFAQTFTDGPIQLQVQLKDWKINYNETDAAILGVGFAPDEPVLHLWGRDNADLDGQGWLGGACHTYSTNLPTTITNINEMLINYTYPTATVPQYYDLRIDAFEDDNGSGDDNILGLSCSGGTFCGFDNPSCCGIVIFGACVGLTEGDDKHCNQNPWLTNRPYRNGPPCEWFDQGFAGSGTCSGDYEVRMETFWRYTKGDACNNAMDLGTLVGGGSLSNYNSNVCYGNSHAAQPGNDVWYKFHVNGPIGIDASLCGTNGAQFDSWLYLYSACGGAPDTLNNDACGNQSSISFSLCQAGDYYLVVDANSPADQGTFTLTVTENPNFVFAVTANTTNVTCNGLGNGTATAAVTGGLPPYTYSWSTGATTSMISSQGPGSPCVTVTDNQGCVATACGTINEPLAMTASTNGNPVTCGGACDGSATVTPSGGTTPYSYAWNSLPPQQLSTATYLCAGNYNVTVTDANGCTASAIANVPNTITMTITLNTLTQVQCFGLNNGAIDLTTTGGNAPLVYSWSNTSQTTEDLTNLGPNTYTLTVTDNTGCTSGGSWTITEPPLLTSAIAATLDPLCNGAATGVVNITVNGGVQPYSYLWSAPSNSTSEDIFNVTAAIHTVTVTDANGCTATASATLNQPAPLAVLLQTTAVSCYGDNDGTASVQVSGGTPGYAYFWSDFTTTAATNSLDGGPFTVIIEDTNGCDTIITGTIAEPGEIDVTLSAVEPLCATAGNGQITTVVTGGTSPFSFAWTGSGGFTSTVQDPSVSSGSYTVVVSDAANCTATSSIGVNAPTELLLTVSGVDPACIGDSSGVVMSNPTGGVSPYTYTWSIPTTVNSYFIENLTEGTYSLTVTDANNCTVTGTASIEYPEVQPQSCKNDLYVVIIPSAFSPNGDGMNDVLHPIQKNVQSLELQVFNRWGEQVFADGNMTFTGSGWDGTFKGEAQPMGTYVFYYMVTYTNGERAQASGPVTLIR